MVKVLLSDRKYKNIIQSLEECEDLQIQKLLFILMLEVLWKFRHSSNDTKRMGLVQMAMEKKKIRSQAKLPPLKVRMAKTSLEEGTLLAEVLKLYEEIRSGQRNDVLSVQILLGFRSKLFD